MRRVAVVLFVLLLSGSVSAIHFETTINTTDGYVDITLVETIQFTMELADAAYLDLCIRAGLPGAQFFPTYPEGIAYSHNGAPEGVTSGVHMPFDESFGFVQAGDVLLVDQTHWNIFQAGDTYTYHAGTVRLPWNPAVTYLPSGDYDVYIVNDQFGTLYSRFPTVENEDLSWGAIKTLFR